MSREHTDFDRHPVLGPIFALGGGNAPAQQTAVCSETPATGERVECTEDATSSDEIRLILKGIDIDTMDDAAYGIYGHHEGSGKIFIDLQTGLDESAEALIRNDIDTTGDNAPGVYGRHVGSGNVEIGAQDAYITKTGARPQSAGGPTLHAGPHAVRMASASVRFILALLKEESS